MPPKPKRPCHKSGCPELTTERFCKAHACLKEQMRKHRHKEYDRYQRDRQAATFYKSKEWEMARQQALIRDHGLCQDCLQNKHITPADVVDHIKPLRLFWQLRVMLSNLRSLCNRCHAIKTAEDKRKYGGAGG